MLIEHAASVGLKDKYGLNAFHYACIHERTELVKVFLNAIDFDLNARDRQGNTALHYAVASGNEELLRILIEALQKYQKSVDIANKKGITSLIHAYRTHNIACGDLLAEFGHANLDITDPVEEKSAREWKEEALQTMAEERRSLKRPRSAFSRLQMNQINQNQMNHIPIRPTSASKTFSNISRIPSAPPMGRPSAQKENNEEEVLSKNKIGTRLYRSASSSNLRNKPEYILNVSPLTHFNGNRFRHCRHGHYVQQEDGSWRLNMKTLYKDFDYQFTQTFRKAAKTPEHLIGLHPLRALSPNPSDGPESTRNVKGGRRQSMRSPTNLEAGRRQRIGSAASTRGGGRRPSVNNKLTVTDSSSSESVNSAPKQAKRKNSQEMKDDVSDTSTLSNKSDKGKVQEPPRPVSRASHHPKEVAVNNNLAAIKEEKV